MKEGREVNVRLFTITAAIIAFVAGFAGGEFFPRDREGVSAFWCDKIHEEETMQHKMGDWAAVPLPECEALRRKADADTKGEGTIARTVEKVASFVLPRSW